MSAFDADSAASPVRNWTPVPHSPPCRLCGARLHSTLIDLGDLPLANGTSHRCAPLHIRICDECTLVQHAGEARSGTHAPSGPSVSAAQAANHAQTVRKRLHLTAGSLTIGIGTRSTELLRPFQAAGIPVFGIGPAPVAGIPNLDAVFNTGTAMQVAVRQGCADLAIADNILPYAPDLFDFAAGLATILRPNGIVSLLVPYLPALLQGTRFDAFCHDACTYLSLRVIEHVFRSAGLRVFDATRLPGDGGQLHVLACRAAGLHTARPGLKAVRQAERLALLDRPDLYSGFSARAAAARADIRAFLGNRYAAGRRVVALGATGRGIMLLNGCGIGAREIACAADPDPSKQGCLLPGSRIPVVAPESLEANPPDDAIVLSGQDTAETGPILASLRQRGTQVWALLPRIARV